MLEATHVEQENEHVIIQRYGCSVMGQNTSLSEGRAHGFVHWLGGLNTEHHHNFTNCNTASSVAKGSRDQMMSDNCLYGLRSKHNLHSFRPKDPYS